MRREVGPIIALAFKAVALGMAAVCMALTLMKTVTPEPAVTTATYVILLSIGLFLLSIAAIQEHRLT